MDELASFGAWIKARRKALHLTQDELARQLGVAFGTLRKLESDERRPSPPIAQRLAELLDVPSTARHTFVRVARGDLALDHLFADGEAGLEADVLPRPITPGIRKTPHVPDHHPNNLPIQLTSFVGRDQELAVLQEYMRDPLRRLITLTGPGGTGKTRLALELARNVLGTFPDGVWFVDLAPIRDPSLVPTTIATILGVKAAGDEPLVETLKKLLREKRVLLVLDNFEQVLAAAPILAAVLNATTHLKLLVTSRAVLHLSGEHEYPVSPLAVPVSGAPAQPMPSLEQLACVAAVELFVQRAQSARHDFKLVERNATAVAEICVRLDGLPLAIELAAARCKVFTPQALLQRLSQPLAVLIGGARDVHARQQTLRSTIDWSYTLLDTEEQHLFARLGVFVGGCTIEAAAAVCNADGDLMIDVLDGLLSLVDKSLLRHIEGVDGEPRFTMLEMIHEYAWEQSATRNEVEQLRGAHAAWFLGLAETAAATVRGADQETSLHRLAAEHGNFRAVFRWAREQHDLELIVRLSVALQDYYRIRGDLAEVRAMLDYTLHQQGDVPAAIRLQALTVAGSLAGNARDYRRAEALLDESLALARRLSEPTYLMVALREAGWIARVRGEHGRAQPLLEECVKLARELGDVRRLQWAQGNLAVILQAKGDLAGAVALVIEANNDALQIGDNEGLGWGSSMLGRWMIGQGDDRTAARYLAEGMQHFHLLDHWDGVAFAVDGFAGLAASQHRPERAARLLGAAAALRNTIHVPEVHSDEMRDYAWYLSATRSQLDDNAFAAAWAAGQAMTLEEIVAYVLEETTFPTL